MDLFMKQKQMHTYRKQNYCYHWEVVCVTGKPWWLEGLLFRGPGISGGLQRADPTSCPSVSELFEHRKSQLRGP